MLCCSAREETEGLTLDYRVGKVWGQPTWCSGKCVLQLSRRYCPSWRLRYSDDSKKGGQEKMVCGIHRSSGEGEERLQLVICCSAREETEGLTLRKHSLGKILEQGVEGSPARIL